jgi:hypothetical protein
MPRQATVYTKRSDRLRQGTVRPAIRLEFYENAMLPVAGTLTHSVCRL